MKFFKNNKGLILAEALLAISMLTIGIVVTSTIIQNALESTRLSKNYLVAQNLATEGIEAVKSIRDTNWLNDPDEPACWLRIDPDTTCDAAYLAAPETSYTAVSESGKFKLIISTAELDLDLSESTAVDFLLDYTELGDPFNITTFEHDGVDASPYYRSIKFLAISEFNTDALFEVKVQWKEGQKTRSVVRTFTLYNYL